MEELIQTVIAVIVIGAALVFKLMEMSSKKKMSLPLPQMEPEEEFFEEPEIRPEPKKETIPVVKNIKPVPSPKFKEKISIPASEGLKFSLSEFQKGIILSAILGPPKSRLKRITAR